MVKAIHYTIFSSIQNNLLNLHFYFSESQHLPRQPPLELCLGQSLECIKLMAKAGLGACAYASLEGILQD